VKYLNFATFSTLFMMIGCVTEMPVSFTEDYIRSEIQTHESGSLKELKIFPLKLITTNGKILDAFGYVMDEKKYILFAMHGTQNDNCGSQDYCFEYIIDESQISFIVSKYADLKAKISQEKFISGEVFTADYNLNSDIFISIRATSPSAANLEIWIKGVKHILPASSTINKFKRFLEGRTINSSPL
jgi:hypothetical protein